MLVWTQNDGCSRTDHTIGANSCCSALFTKRLLEQGRYCNISYTVPEVRGLRFISHLRTFSHIAIVCDKIKKEI